MTPHHHASSPGRWAGQAPQRTTLEVLGREGGNNGAPGEVRWTTVRDGRRIARKEVGRRQTMGRSTGGSGSRTAVTTAVTTHTSHPRGDLGQASAGLKPPPNKKKTTQTGNFSSQKSIRMPGKRCPTALPVAGRDPAGTRKQTRTSKSILFRPFLSSSQASPGCKNLIHVSYPPPGYATRLGAAE